MQPAEKPKPKNPAVGFFGIKLVGKKVVISIDSGGSMGENFDYVVKGAAYAMQQLDSSQQVKIVIWRSPPMMIPEGNAFAKKGDKVFRELDNVYSSPSGQDEVSNTADSLNLGADQTIFVTAKLDIKGQVAESPRNPNQRVDVIRIGSGGDDDDPYKKLSTFSSGTYIRVESDKIKEYYKQSN